MIGANEAIEVLRVYRESAVVDRDHSIVEGWRREYWQERIEALDTAIQALEKRNQCPYIHTSDEGTSFCELSTRNAQEFDELVEALERVLTAAVHTVDAAADDDASMEMKQSCEDAEALLFKNTRGGCMNNEGHLREAQESEIGALDLLISHARGHVTLPDHILDDLYSALERKRYFDELAEALEASTAMLERKTRTGNYPSYVDAREAYSQTQANRALLSRIRGGK